MNVLMYALSLSFSLSFHSHKRSVNQDDNQVTKDMEHIQ